MARLVDSGVDDFFLDQNLARQAGLPLVKFAEPNLVLDLDGPTLTRVTHQIDSVMLLVSGNQQIQFFLIPSSSAPAILRSPWLARHNPQIDWSTGSLTGWSVSCHSHCLHSALPPAPPSSSPTPAPADLSAIPEVYHEVKEVFSKHRALLLPSQPPL